MKSFRSYLLEKTVMTVSDAMALLGLKLGFTAQEFKSAYRAAAIKYHPDKDAANKVVDKNGFTMIQKVNLAAETLEGKAGAATAQANRDQQRRDYEAKDEAYYEVTKETFLNTYKAEPFRAHFEKVFGEPFSTTKDTIIGRNAFGSPYMFYAGEWSNASRSIVLYVSITVHYSDMFNSRAISNPDQFLTMSIVTEILYNRKKVKLSQQNYSMAKDRNTLTDPNIIFPADKLKKQSAKSVDRKFSKRDALLTFDRELGAKVRDNGDFIWVPISDTIEVLLYRHVMMKLAAYGINGVYEKKDAKNYSGQKKAQGPTMFVYEKADHMDYLIDGLKAMQTKKLNSVEAVSQALQALSVGYKAFRDANPEK